MVLVQGAVWQAGKVSKLQINQSRTANESTLVVEILLLVIARISEILCLFRNFARSLQQFNNNDKWEIPSQCLYGDDYDLLASIQQKYLHTRLVCRAKWCNTNQP